MTRSRRWPSVDYYAALQPTGAEAHPLDLLLDAAPDVRRAQRQVKGLEGDLLAVGAAAREYADARLHLATLRENLAFSIGVELGVAAGRADALRGGRRDGVLLALRRVANEANLGAKERLLVFIEAAWALARGPVGPRAVATAVRRRMGRGRRRSKSRRPPVHAPA